LHVHTHTHTHTLLVCRPDGKRPLGRPRHRSKGNLRMDLREAECECVGWIHLAQDRNQ